MIVAWVGTAPSTQRREVQARAGAGLMTAQQQGLTRTLRV
jgi:hypothetical protein